MKIAFAGKGGAGKTTISSLVIDRISKKYKTLALDLDSNVNLATSLGFNNVDELITFGTKKEEVMNYTGSTKMSDWENRVYLPTNTDGFYDYESDFINKYSISNENIKLMSLGFIEDEKRGIESMCDYYEMSKVFMNHINLKDDQFLIADLAAGVEMISRATVMSFDLIFVITDANFKNIKVAKQILNGLDLIGFSKEEIIIIPNKYIDKEDLLSIKNEFIGYNLLDGIEFDSEIYDLDSKKQLFLSKSKQLDCVIENIVNNILKFKNSSNIKIIERIKKLDEKKQNFLK